MNSSRKTSIGWLLGMLCITALASSALASSALASSARSQCWNFEDEVLISESPAAEDRFGGAIAMEGPVAIIGSAAEWGLGLAYVYQYDGVNWQWVQTLASSNSRIDDRFGRAIAMEGNLAAISASNSYEPARVYLFRFIAGSGWMQFQTLAPSDSNARSFGASLALSDGVLFVGAYDEGPGSVFVFRQNQSTGRWEEEAILAAAEGQDEDRFGWSLAAQGNLAVVGAPGEGTLHRSGAAYVFVRSPSTGDWERVRKLTARERIASAEFGISVALTGSDILVGSPRDIVDRLESGSLFVFRNDGVTWREVQRLGPQDAKGSELFGEGVAALGEDAIVSAPGSNSRGVVTTLHFDGEAWIEVLKCTPSSATTLFQGSTVALGDRGFMVNLCPYCQDPGAVTAYRWSRLGLGLNAEEFYVGDDLRVTACAGAIGAPVALLLVAVNGSATFRYLATGRFDADREWWLNTVVPPGLSGSELELLALGVVAPSQLVASLTRTVSFR